VRIVDVDHDVGGAASVACDPDGVSGSGGTRSDALPRYALTEKVANALIKKKGA
jgi:hypothetical protein